MSDAHVVIIGAGQGGTQAAMSLRQVGYAGPITLFGDEAGLPYMRPPLSKAYLKSGEAERLTLRSQSFFDSKGITLRAGQRVDRIDRTARQVFVAGETIPYGHLILATGTRNMTPPIKGMAHTMGLRTLEDARCLRAKLDQPCKVAVIGGGFIGLEFAAVARTLGHEVALAEAAPRLMARAVSPQMSAQFAQMHRAQGTCLYLGNAVAGIDAGAITLADGTAIEANFILLAAGVTPNVELAEAAGLNVDNGIMVDDRLRTSDAHIFALGDCARFPNPQGGAPVRLESVQAATDHARAIAKTITCGDAGPYGAVPWFWSDQADWKLQIAGLAGVNDDSVAVCETTILRFDGARLSAVETINNAKTHMKARRIFALPGAPSRDMLAQKDYDLSAF